MATQKGLFSPDLISPEITTSFPETYTIRPLEREDYHRGFFQCIQVLVETGDVSEERFRERYDWMKNQGQGIHYFLVIEHENQIIGTGTVVVERKLYVHSQFFNGGKMADDEMFEYS
jgi:glucosamine-phosphate N-acetyltransferase